MTDQDYEPVGNAGNQEVQLFDYEPMDNCSVQKTCTPNNVPNYEPVDEVRIPAWEKKEEQYENIQ